MATPANNLNVDQHAGGGPQLTGSGVGVDGVRTVDAGTGLALGSGTNANTPGNIITDMALIGQTFDKVIRLRNRWEPMYRNFANVRAVRDAAYPGSKVTIFRTGANGLALAKNPLSEYADPDAKPLKGLEDSIDVTVNEYGDSTVVTNRLKRFSWADINPMQVEQVRRHMADSIDALYMEAVYANKGGFSKKGFRQAYVDGTGALKFTTDSYTDPLFGSTTGWGTAALPTAAGTTGTTFGKLSDSAIRRIVGEFRSKGVAPYANGLYLGLITPDVSIQLRETTNLAGWRYPHLDGTANGNIWKGTVGLFEGVMFVEGSAFHGLAKGGTIPDTTNNIVNVFPGATKGDGSDKGSHVYDNLLFVGSEGICDVVVEEPHVVVTPTGDRFNRLFGLGWIGCLGAQVYDPFAGLLVAVDAKA